MQRGNPRCRMGRGIAELADKQGQKRDHRACGRGVESGNDVCRERRLREKHNLCQLTVWSLAIDGHLWCYSLQK